VEPGTCRLTLSEPPSLNRKYVSRNFVLSKEYRSWKNQTGLILQSQGYKPFKEECSVYMVWYRKAKRGDIDSKIKVTLDALEGHIFENDKQVKMLCIERKEDKENPRIELMITKL